MSDVPMSPHPALRCSRQPVSAVATVLTLWAALLIGLLMPAEMAEAASARKPVRLPTPKTVLRSAPRPLPQPLPVATQPSLQFVAAETGRSRHPVRIDRIEAEVEIAGQRASTRLTLDWTPLPAAESARLPSDDGALWLPLVADQQVSAVAVQTLDQPPRPAVVLGSRSLAVSTGADAASFQPPVPAFRIDMHPWWRSTAGPEQGVRQGRRIVLVIEQSLVPVPAGRGGGWAWMLPVVPEAQACPVRVRIQVHDELPARGNARARPGKWLTAGGAEAGPITPLSDHGTSVWTWQSLAHQGPVGLQLAAPEHPVISLGTHQQQAFVYAEIPFADWVHSRRVRPAQGPKSRPVALIWDASATRALSDHSRELELIERWLARLDRSERIDIDLYLGRERAEPAGHFRVGPGNWAALRRVLEQVSYAGIGQPQAWKVPEGADRVLLFSDGLEPDPTAPEAGHAVPAGRTGPVMHAVLASAQGDEMRLRRLAEASGGRLIDLLRQSPDAAAADLVRSVPRIVSIRSKGLRDLHIVSRRPELGRLVLAAGVAHPEEQPLKAQATLVLRWPGGDTEERAIDFSRASAHRAETSVGPGLADLAAQRWLALQLRSLTDPDQRERLARRYGVGVPSARMAVLAQAADYARLRLPPPDVGTLRADYQRARNQPSEAPRGWPQRQERIEQLWSRPTAAGEGARPVAAVEPNPSALAEMVLMVRHGGSGLTTQDDDWIERLRLAAPAVRAQVLAEEQRRQKGRAIFDLVAADLLFGLGEEPLAVRTLSSLIDVELEDPALLRAVVLRMLAHRQPELAVLAARRWAQQRPDQAEAWYWVAQAQRELGQIEAAFAALERGLLLAPSGEATGQASLQPDLAPLILDDMQTLAAQSVQLHSFHQLERTLPPRPSALRVQLSAEAGMLSRLRWVASTDQSNRPGALVDCPDQQGQARGFGTLTIGAEWLCRIGGSLSPGQHELWIDPGAQWPLPLALARVVMRSGDAAARELTLWVNLRPGQPQRLAVVDVDERGAIRNLDIDPALSPRIPRLADPVRTQM